MEIRDATFKVVDSGDEASTLSRTLAMNDGILKKAQFAVKSIDATLHLPTIDARQHGPKRIEDAGNRHKNENQSLHEFCKPERQCSLQERWPRFVKHARLVADREIDDFRCGKFSRALKDARGRMHFHRRA